MLNIVAHPHPTGIYPELLKMIAGQRVKFWGDEHAAITNPTEVEEGIHQGRIAIWAEIDKDQPAIDLRNLEEIPLEETNTVLPNNIGFNGRVFVYTLNENNHTLFIEAKNDLGKNLSPSRAHRIFSALLSPTFLPSDAPNVEITVVPEDDSVKRLLSIPRLDYFHIFLTRPNVEEFGLEAEEILIELEKKGARSQETIRRRSPEATSLRLDENDRKLAHVASHHGYLEVKGRYDDGEKFAGSTKEYPKIISKILDQTNSFAAEARRVAKNYIPSIRQR